MSDLIVKGAGEIKDGLYNIKDGKLFKYKANGGTVRTYPIVSADRPKGRWEMKPDPYGFFDEIPVCSECGCTTKMRESYKFCPNCGSYNGGGEE